MQIMNVATFLACAQNNKIVERSRGRLASRTPPTSFDCPFGRLAGGDAVALSFSIIDRVGATDGNGGSNTSDSDNTGLGA